MTVPAAGTTSGARARSSPRTGAGLGSGVKLVVGIVAIGFLLFVFGPILFGAGSEPEPFGWDDSGYVDDGTDEEFEEFDDDEGDPIDGGVDEESSGDTGDEGSVDDGSDGVTSDDGFSDDGWTGEGER